MNSNSKISYKLNNGVLSIACVAYLLSRYFSITMVHESLFFSSMYTNLSRLSAVIIILIYIIRFKYSFFSLLLMLYSLALLFSTIINNASIYKLFMMLYPMIGMCLYIELKMSTNPIKLIKGFTIASGFPAIISAILSIISPSMFGEYTYFAGIKNQIGLLYIIFVALQILLSTYSATAKKLIPWSISILSISILFINSSNNMIAWVIFLIGICLSKIKLTASLITYKNTIIACILMFFMIVIYRAFNMFAWLIEDILRKDMTLTSRTLIWDTTIEKINQRFWLGYGMGENGDYFHISVNNVISSFSAHDQFLQSLYEGGFISFIFIILLFIFVGKKITHNNYDTTRQVSILLVAFISVFTILMLEAATLNTFFIILAFLFNINKLIDYKSDINANQIRITKSAENSLVKVIKS